MDNLCIWGLIIAVTGVCLVVFGLVCWIIGKIFGQGIVKTSERDPDMPENDLNIHLSVGELINRSETWEGRNKNL